MEQIERLNLPPDIANEVRRGIDTVAIDWKDDPSRVGEIAHTVGALPLLLDMGGFFALKADGVLVAVPWDNPEKQRIVTSKREKDIALLAGSTRYPVLARFVPRRPPDARPCPTCRGTGVPAVAAQAGLTNVRCWCGGLGWIPSDWDRPIGQ